MKQSSDFCGGCRRNGPPGQRWGIIYKDLNALSESELNAHRHRLARFQPRTPTAELAALRVRLETLVDANLRSDCLKYISELSLKKLAKAGHYD